MLSRWLASRAAGWVAVLLGLAAGCAGENRAPQPAVQPPLWVIGLDGADWRYLDRLMGAGAMPELARLVRGGRRGVLVTEQPPLSPLVWTTMMTGVSPLQHRILDFARLRPGDGVPEPITSSERRRPAIWNMATAGGRRAVVLGLWATYPAEAISGLVVSDRFFSFLHPQEAPAGAVSPATRQRWAVERLDRARAAAELTGLRAYVPDLRADELAASDLGGDPYARPLSALRRILVETSVYDSLFRDAVAELDPALAILYLQGTDSVGHAFARYTPPALPGLLPAESARWGRVPATYFRHVDRLLGEYRRLAERRGARLLVVSDHGFRWGDDRPPGLSSSANGTAARWHREEGIWLLWGQGVIAGAGARGGVRQVCATLLDLLGLPPGVGLAGPSLAAGALAARPGPERAAVDYRIAFRPPRDAPPVADPGGTEALAALRALGYAAGDAGEATGSGRRLAPDGGDPEHTRTAASFDNEGLLLRQAGRTRDAQGAFELALARAPRDPSAAWNLSELLRDEPAARERSDRLLLQAVAGGLPEGAEALARRALALAAAGERPRALRLAQDGCRAVPADPRLWLLAGQLDLQREECPRALVAFERAAALSPERAEAHAAIGVARLCLGDAAGAAAALRRSLLLDPNQPQLQRQLAALGG